MPATLKNSPYLSDAAQRARVRKRYLDTVHDHAEDLQRQADELRNAPLANAEVEAGRREDISRAMHWVLDEYVRLTTGTAQAAE